MKQYIEVWRPNPARLELCEVTDQHPRGEGYFVGVRCGDGAEFVAAKHMGSFGQQDGWFGRAPLSEVRQPE